MWDYMVTAALWCPCEEEVLYSKLTNRHLEKSEGKKGIIGHSQSYTRVSHMITKTRISCLLTVAGTYNNSLYNFCFYVLLYQARNNP